MTFVQAIVLGIFAFLGTIATVFGSIKVARIARGSTDQANKDTSTLAWAKQVTDRLTAVEATVAANEVTMRNQDRVITASTGYIDALLWWVFTGMKGPMPRPPSIIHEHLDPNLLGPSATAEESSP